LRYHIAKTEIANVLLAELSPGDVQTFVEHLEKNLSTEMARKIYHTLSTGLKYCRKHQWLRHVPTEDIRIESRGRESSGKVGIPSKAEIGALLKAADQDIRGIDGAVIRVMAFCGLRPSEMRGLTRPLLHFDNEPAMLEVAQRADVYCKIGKPKSRAGYRKIPIGPDTVKALKRAMLARQAGRYGLVFPNEYGGVMSYYNFAHRRWPQLMKRAGLAKIEIVTYKSSPDRKVKKIVPNFTPYALRHVAASLWIEMGLAPKRIQELMGHTSLKMTMDTYGHLWSNPEADKRIAAEIERAVG
jgi:integrase